MPKVEKELMIEIVVDEESGEVRKFKSFMYFPERHYEIEEKLAAVGAAPMAHLFGALDAAGGASAAASAASGGAAGTLNAAAIAAALQTLFSGLKGEGGFYKFAQLVLSDTSEVMPDGKAVKVKIDSWRGQEVLIEDLTFHVLRHNFESYFLSRWQKIKHLLPEELISALEKKEDLKATKES